MKIFSFSMSYLGLWFGLGFLQATSPYRLQEEEFAKTSPRPAEGMSSVKPIHRAQASSITELLGHKKRRNQIKPTDSAKERPFTPAYSPSYERKHKPQAQKPSLLHRFTKKVKRHKKTPHEPQPHSAELTELPEPEGLPLKTLRPSQHLQAVEGEITPIQQETSPAFSSIGADLSAQEDAGQDWQIHFHKRYSFISNKGIRSLPDPKRNPHSLSRRPRPKAQELAEKEGKIVPVEHQDFAEQ